MRKLLVGGIKDNVFEGQLSKVVAVSVDKGLVAHEHDARQGVGSVTCRNASQL